MLLENPRLRPNVLGWISAAMTAGLLLAGLWPLNFSPHNNAGWLAGTNGLHFPGGEARSSYDPGGIVFSPHPFSASASPNPVAGALSLEIVLRPAQEPAGARARILSFADAAGVEPFFVGQWSTHLLVMIRRSNARGDEAAFREHDVNEALKAGQSRLITLTSDERGTAIYLDGRMARQIPGVSLLHPNASLAGHRVFLGNSPDGLHPWAGDVFGLALYDRALSPGEVQQNAAGWLHLGEQPAPALPLPLARYAFNQEAGEAISNQLGPINTLFMPALLVQRKPALSLDGFFRPGLGDLALNVGGFVPYGLAIALWLVTLRPSPHWAVPVIAMAAGATISLLIECVQVALPMRDSSMLDLAANTLGALLGGLVPIWARG